MKKILILLCIAFLFLFSSCDKGYGPKQEKESAKRISTTTSISTAPIVESQVPISIPKAESIKSFVDSGALKALEVRKQYLLPILDGIKSVPVKCDKLIDDPEALTEYRKITNPEPAPPPLKLIDEKMEGDMNSCKNLVEIEKYLQESSKGHLAYKPWSSYTVNALAQIYTNYPCTEAGLLALMDILIVIWRPDYLYYCANADMQDIETTMHDHIIKNYPNTWETELIKYWEDNRKIKGNWNLERISKNALLIQYCENNNLLGNKYFLLFTQRGQSQSNFIAKLYNNSARIYFANGRNARTESVKRTGKLSSEAVDYCQKGFNIFEEGIKKYPNTIELRYNEKGIPNATGAETCYNMVHRLDFYKDK